MYRVWRNGRYQWEADACGIGFLATRKGVAERPVVEHALALCGCFDHRGAPGHGSGIQCDIPWPLLLERFPGHGRVVAQRDCALGMFFLPFDAGLRRRCVDAIERLAEEAGSGVLGWADVPMDLRALPSGGPALRSVPVVRQALFGRGSGMGEEEWFACRFLLRLALDERLTAVAGDDFAVASLSNRTVVYKGLVELSKIGQLYPDLRDGGFASRYVLFHSRYCTNTTTAWRRAQPFWALAHNGEVNTVAGNVAWMEAIGGDLLRMVGERFPRLAGLAGRVRSVVTPNGSDSAALDDMLIALAVGGMSLEQAVCGLLPEASERVGAGDPLREFTEATKVVLGACDGPAAVVACDGTTAVAHLDRNGLRPLWLEVTDDYAIAESEITGTRPMGHVREQRIMGPGETFIVDLDSGRVFFEGEARERVARGAVPEVSGRFVEGGSGRSVLVEEGELARVQQAFGMGVEDLDVLVEAMAGSGKPSVGSMGDDTAVSAILDTHPRRLEGYFKLRFAQETSPPIDPVRDADVFDTSVVLGDRRGLWSRGTGPLYRFGHRVLSGGEGTWLGDAAGVQTVDLSFAVMEGVAGLEARLGEIRQEAVERAGEASVLVFSDLGIGPERGVVPVLRAVSVAHSALVSAGLRQKVGILAMAGVWDIAHCALLVTMGADAVCPWLGCASASVYGEGAEARYLGALREGFREAMSMVGVTPASAYCGARMVEAVGLDFDLLAEEFGGVPGHLEGIGRDILDSEWLSLHASAYELERSGLADRGEYRHTKGGMAHGVDAQVVRAAHAASGYSAKIHGSEAGSRDAYRAYSELVRGRRVLNLLDCLRLKSGDSLGTGALELEEVEPVERILWRFMAPGMSEGALSESAHRAVARGMNLLRRYCRIRAGLSGVELPAGVGPVANSGEGGFDPGRVGTRDWNRSVQYAGGRFTITPWTAATAEEAEVKFAQGAKPGKGGQLPGKKVGALVARRRGCLPGYELVSPPINHNLYSIEDVKLMLESWRHLNPLVGCALKFVATTGVEAVCVGGVNAGATRLHVSDGCGGTGAAKRVDQKFAGVPVVAVLPGVHDQLVEDGVRHLVELSVDGGVQTGEQALKLMLLGADRVGFGTSLLLAVGCSMLRKCHLAGPDPRDPSGTRRLGCAPGVATQDPALVAKFKGTGRHVARLLLYAAEEVRELMAAHGIRSLDHVVGSRDRLEVRPDLEGKAALLDLRGLVGAPGGRALGRDLEAQRGAHLPARRSSELDAAEAGLAGEDVVVRGRVTNQDRCVGVQAAGVLARAVGDGGLRSGSVRFEHEGAAGHFYAAYAVPGMEFELRGLAADSVFTAVIGGRLVVVPAHWDGPLTVVGNAFGYGARGGEAFLAGRGGNRFGICFRRSLEGSGPVVVVEGVGSNAFQYMTGGTVLLLGGAGRNLGAGMTGGVVYALDLDEGVLNPGYVRSEELGEEDVAAVLGLLRAHRDATGSVLACGVLGSFEAGRFRKVVTRLEPEEVD